MFYALDGVVAESASGYCGADEAAVCYGGAWAGEE